MTLPELNAFMRLTLIAIEYAIMEEGFATPSNGLAGLREEALKDLLIIQLEDFNRN